MLLTNPPTLFDFCPDLIIILLHHHHRYHQFRSVTFSLIFIFVFLPKKHMICVIILYSGSIIILFNFNWLISMNYLKLVVKLTPLIIFVVYFYYYYLYVCLGTHIFLLEIPNAYRTFVRDITIMMKTIVDEEERHWL